MTTTHENDKFCVCGLDLSQHEIAMVITKNGPQQCLEISSSRISLCCETGPIR